MSRLKTLYTQLITHRPGDVNGWLNAYRSFTADVGRVRTALAAGKDLRERDSYVGTRWLEDGDPWNAFAHELIRTNNGVTGIGQSVLRKDSLDAFISDDDYVASLAALIREPLPIHFTAFAARWEVLRQQHGVGRNPLLINRVGAACSLDVTSTVHQADFERVYHWLLEQKLLPLDGETIVGWYARNVFLMDHLRHEFRDMLSGQETDEHTLSAFVWQLRANLASPFELKKQIVRYGAPGTGKTFSALRDTRLQFDVWKAEFGDCSELTHEQCCQTVQFHPSYGYEDFLEGLRPILIAGKSQLVLQNGVFKRLCMTAGRWERDVYLIFKDGSELCRNWSTLRIADLLQYRAEYLHHSYWDSVFSYHDHERLVADAIPPFFLIIDEINRAELARVLGELMICLEYRGPSHAIMTQYASMNDDNTGMLRTDENTFKFFVPHNVYLIGTMNTIDRSVESFDLALRRRFSWQRVDPDIGLLRHHLATYTPGWSKLADRLEALNNTIRSHELLGPDYQIGHAYLMNLPYSYELEESEVRRRVWADSLGPLLEEYVRGSGSAEHQLATFKSAFGLK
jgi:5-methylcytosine-specific restriction protein B